MNNEQTPDYGEPWQPMGDDEIWSDNEDEGTLAVANGCIRERIIASVNACAGIADPEKSIAMLKQAGVANARLHLEAVDAAAELAAMRGAIRKAHTALEGCLKYMLSVSVCNLDLEYETMDDAHLAIAKLQPFIKP